jgi:hypothetical protein
MGEAQIAEGSLADNSWQPLNPQYPPGEYQQADFLQIMGATGTGIGNTAAHEIGHQFSLPNMDCGTTDQPCVGTGPQSNFYDYYSASGYPPSQASSGAQSIYLYIGPPLKWSSDDANALQQMLLTQ